MFNDTTGEGRRLLPHHERPGAEPIAQLLTPALTEQYRTPPEPVVRHALKLVSGESE